MKDIAAVSELLRGKPTDSVLIAAEVTSVNDDTCTVKIDNLLYDDVRLRITDEPASDKLVIKPKVGTNVIVADLSGGQRRILAIVQVETVDEFLLTKGTIKFKITDDGFEIARNGLNLSTVLSGFFDEVMKIIVVQGTTPNVPALNMLKDQLNQILC